MMSLRQTLERDPSRFAFDAAVRILLHEAGNADPAEAARFSSPPNLIYPGAEIQAVEPGTPHPTVQTTVIGMTGPSGTLPRGYSEAVTTATRDRSPSLHAFLNLLAERFIAQFARAGSKYRQHRTAEDATLDDRPDPVGRAVLALTGYANADLGDRLGAGQAAVQHYAGFFAARPRSADRLAALASDWLGHPVQVRQFAGAWLTLPHSERSALPCGRGESTFSRLGVDAAIGERAWELQSRVVIAVGPLDQPSFAGLLPGGPTLGPFVALIRAFLGYQAAFAVRLVLQRRAIPQLAFNANPAPRLGWNCWLKAPDSARPQDADDAIFDAEVIEAAAA